MNADRERMFKEEQFKDLAQDLEKERLAKQANPTVRRDGFSKRVLAWLRRQPPRETLLVQRGAELRR